MQRAGKAAESEKDYSGEHATERRGIHIQVSGRLLVESPQSFPSIPVSTSCIEPTAWQNSGRLEVPLGCDHGPCSYLMNGGFQMLPPGCRHGTLRTCRVHRPESIFINRVRSFLAIFKLQALGNCDLVAALPRHYSILFITDLSASSCRRGIRPSRLAGSFVNNLYCATIRSFNIATESSIVSPVALIAPSVNEAMYSNDSPTSSSTGSTSTKIPPVTLNGLGANVLIGTRTERSVRSSRSRRS